jgi:YHS domain-containing protein
MNTQLPLAIALASAFVPGTGVAQREAYAAGDPQAAAGMAQCAQVQPVVDNIITAATARLESARQSNSAAEMRAAVDNLQAALRDIRAQLSPCAAAGAEAGAHAGRTMPGMQQPRGAPAPAAPMEHSKMPMGSAPAGKPGATTGTKPAAPTAPMDHSKMPMGGEAKPGKVMDPVNGLMVDPASSPKTTYQGQTYYFSSEQTRKEFLKNPAKFAKKSKG